MSVAIHPSETRRSESGAVSRSRLPLIAGIAGGSVALAVFAAGAFSFFSGLADPRAKPVRIAPVASQWPDLKDGVPALTVAETRPEARPIDLPAAQPVQAPIPASTPPAVSPPAPARAEAPEPAPVPTRARLQIEPAQTVPSAARTTTAVAPSKVATPLPPTRTETVRAKAEQPARFVSLPAPKAKAETPKGPAVKAEVAKADAKVDIKAKGAAGKPEAAKLDTAHKSSPSPLHRAVDTKATQTASAEAPASQDKSDEPELLGVKIPGGRQIRDGWDAAVKGLIGKSDGE